MACLTCFKLEISERAQNFLTDFVSDVAVFLWASSSKKAAAEFLGDLVLFRVSREDGGRWQCQIEELSFTELESIHPWSLTWTWKSAPGSLEIPNLEIIIFSGSSRSTLGGVVFIDLLS